MVAHLSISFFAGVSLPSSRAESPVSVIKRTQSEAQMVEKIYNRSQGAEADFAMASLAENFDQKETGKLCDIKYCLDTLEKASLKYCMTKNCL